MDRSAPGKGVKGIVFDLDGTLVNSTIDFLGMKRRMIALLEGRGLPEGILRPTETTVDILERAEAMWRERGFAESEWKRIRAELDAVMDRAELEAIPTLEAVDGAVEAVRRLRMIGYRLAVLTRGHQLYAVEALRRTGMLGHFDLVLGRDGTPRPKPSAEALHHAAKLMGLGLDAIVFVGDHHIDHACAENARVGFVGVRTGPRGDDSWGGRRPDTLLSGVGDLPEHLSRV